MAARCDTLHREAVARLFLADSGAKSCAMYSLRGRQLQSVIRLCCL